MSIPGMHPRVDRYRAMPDHPHMTADDWAAAAKTASAEREHPAIRAEPADGLSPAGHVAAADRRTAWLAVWYYCRAQTARIEDRPEEHRRMAGSFHQALNWNLIDDATADILDDITAETGR